MLENSLINHRIVFNDSIGTIKYVGLVEGTDTELWYGIEWDDSSRGKHDGSYKGKRYFQTEHVSGGSFVRPNKVEFGIEIFDAAKQKYFNNNDLDNKTKNDENIEKILYDNTGNLGKLKCVSLAYCKVNSLKSIGQFTEKFPYINEIDFEGNLLNSWTELLNSLKHFSNLKLLNLSNNKMTLPDENLTCEFKSVTYLIINKMNYNWNDVLKIIRHFPCLTQLKVCYNSICEINEININLSKHLKVIDLDSNNLTEWKNVIKIGELNELEELYLNNNQISSIYFDDADVTSRTNFFSKLKSLALNQNKIDNWSTINELVKLQNLQEVRFTSNPLNDSDKLLNIREMFIAKLEFLKIFNRTVIDRIEKQSAELYYVKIFFKDYLKATSSNNGIFNSENDLCKAFLRDHPSYLKLVKKYGLPELSEVTVKAETVQASLISITVINDVNKEKLVRKFPSTLTVQRLKIIISKLFAKSGFENDTINLFYISTKKIGDEYELDNDYRDLNFYSVEDGDTIIAKLKNMSDRAYIRIYTK